MTQEATPPIKTLADVLALVNCTSAQGVLWLGRLTALTQDVDPTLLDSLHNATENLQSRNVQGL